MPGRDTHWQWNMFLMGGEEEMNFLTWTILGLSISVRISRMIRIYRILFQVLGGEKPWSKKLYLWVGLGKQKRYMVGSWKGGPSFHFCCYPCPGNSCEQFLLSSPFKDHHCYLIEGNKTVIWSEAFKTYCLVPMPKQQASQHLDLFPSEIAPSSTSVLVYFSIFLP